MKLMKKLGLWLSRGRFNSSECQAAADMAVARIRSLNIQRLAVVKEMRCKIALLLHFGRGTSTSTDACLWIERWVECVIREQNLWEAYDLLELFCLLIFPSDLSGPQARRACPDDLKERISSIIFAAALCSHEIPELMTLTNIFKKKYGRKFVSEATNRRFNSCVHVRMSQKLLGTPTDKGKFEITRDIMAEYQINEEGTLHKDLQDLLRRVGFPCHIPPELLDYDALVLALSQSQTR